jgi:hypothetical protein
VAEPDETRPEEGGPSGSIFWIGVAAGWAFIGYGIVGLLRNATDTHPRNFLAFFLGSALAHDLVLVPLVLAIGWLGVRRMPPAARPAIAVTVVVVGPIVLYAYPFIRGYGRDPHNPSLLPNRYGWALVTTIALVVATTALWGVWTARRKRSDPTQ